MSSCASTPGLLGTLPPITEDTSTSTWQASPNCLLSEGEKYCPWNSATAMEFPFAFAPAVLPFRWYLSLRTAGWTSPLQAAEEHELGQLPLPLTVSSNSRLADLSLGNCRSSPTMSTSLATSAGSEYAELARTMEISLRSECWKT